MVNQLIVWPSNIDDNDKNLATIQRWWTKLDGKRVCLLTEDTQLSSDVESKTEDFTIENSGMKDTELYWNKEGFGNTSLIKAKQLVLDEANNKLNIVCQEPPNRRYEFTVIS